MKKAILAWLTALSALLTNAQLGFTLTGANIDINVRAAESVTGPQAQQIVDADSKAQQALDGLQTKPSASAVTQTVTEAINAIPAYVETDPEWAVEKYLYPYFSSVSQIVNQAINDIPEVVIPEYKNTQIISINSDHFVRIDSATNLVMYEVSYSYETDYTRVRVDGFDTIVTPNYVEIELPWKVFPENYYIFTLAPDSEGTSDYFANGWQLSINTTSGDCLLMYDAEWVRWRNDFNGIPSTLVPTDFGYGLGQGSINVSYAMSTTYATNAVKTFASMADLQAFLDHTTNAGIHVASGEKSGWSNKAPTNNATFTGTMTLNGENVLTTNQLATVCSNQCIRAWMPLTTQTAYGYADLNCPSNSMALLGPAPLNSFVIRPLIPTAANENNVSYSNIVFYCDRTTSDPRVNQGFSSATTGVFTINNWGLASSRGYVMKRTDAAMQFGTSRRNIAAYSLGIAGSSIRLMCLWSPATPAELADADGIIDYGSDAQ
jgi:hypothetical protein